MAAFPRSSAPGVETREDEDDDAMRCKSFLAKVW